MAKAKMTSRTREVPVMECTKCGHDIILCYVCGHLFHEDNEQIICHNDNIIKENHNKHYHVRCI